MRRIFIALIACLSFLGCKKSENVEQYHSSFSYTSGQKYDAPNAYLRVEGYSSTQQIYYLSLTFATGGVAFDTTTKNLKGYGNAIKFYLYSPSNTEVPTGRYPYTNPINPSNVFFQTQKVEVFTNNYSFNYTTNQQGFLYNKTNSGWIDIVKNGLNYDISYVANVGYSNGNLYDPISVFGDFKGELVH